MAGVKGSEISTENFSQLVRAVADWLDLHHYGRIDTMGIRELTPASLREEVGLGEVERFTFRERM